MELKKAEKLAKELMHEHCPEYSFAFDNAKRRMGCCHYDTNQITLSRHLVAINDESRVLNTILHEIAHALTKGHHHGRVWKAKAIELGCDGKRCYNSKEVKTIKANYLYGCETCGHEVKRFRRIRKPLACGRCCNKYNNRKFSDKFILQPKEV
jgi:predicted SprT family Zn-dependent metalloprotease